MTCGVYERSHRYNPPRSKTAEILNPASLMLYKTAIYYYYYYNLLEMEQTRTYNISERRTITVYYKKEDGSVSIRIQDKYCLLYTSPSPRD